MKQLLACVRVGLGLGLVALLASVVGALPATANPLGTGLVISQVYGGGGNTGAPYQNDYIEVFNPTSGSIALAGLTLQYTSATGTGLFGQTATQLTPLTGTLAPGQYLLVQEGAGTNAAPALPTPDITDSTPIAMGAADGKVALVNSAGGLGCNGSTTPCDAAQRALIIDLVGYGTANFFEGATAAPGLSNATAAFRAANGCTDTDVNGSDFAAAAPAPRNTASPLNPCATGVTLTVGDVTLNEGNTGTTSFDFTVGLSGPAGAGGVTFDIATADNSAVSPGDFAAKSLTGQTIPASSTSSTFSVLVNGDTAFEPDETFFVNVTNVTGATVADGQGLGTIVNDDVGACSDAYTPVYSIQGTGPSAAITGNVATHGVVVGDYEGSTGLQGFYLQDLTGDGDPATSDGIFVFTGSANLVSAGQVIRIAGYARERFNQTAINGSNNNAAAVPASSIVNCGSGGVSPTDVTMPFAALDSPERFEGMLVRFPQALVISEYFNYERFGEMVLALPLDGETRPFTGTAIDEPGAPALARTLANTLRRITLDDGLSTQNPSTLRHPNGDPFALDNLFRGGDTVENTVGVLGFDFSLYRIQPTGPADYTAANPRPVAPSPVGGSVQVAAMNTLNFFLTLDYPAGNPLDNTCGGLGGLECRGADSDQPLEFTRQRDKLVAALAGIGADVIGLNEIENSIGVDPLADPEGVVPALNALLGPGTYASIDTGTIGTDAIKVGLIYRPDTVAPVGDFQILDSSDDPRFIDTKSRPVLAQTFEVLETGARFTVAVNHLKSKGSDCLDVGDPDAGDGQGNCNLTREAAAQALVDWLATDPTGSGDADFLIIGDLNSYAKEDPVDAVEAGPDDMAGTDDDYTNLVELFLGTYAYSYVFDGQSGYLDHALSSDHLTSQVTGVAEWHINADEPDAIDYDTSFKPPAQDALYEPNAYRSSDHDPIIVGLDPTPTCLGFDATITGSGTIVGTNGPDVIIGSPGPDTIYGGNGDDVICGGLGNDTIDGGNGNDLVAGDTSTSQGNAAAPGGNDRILGGNGDDQLFGEGGSDVVSGQNGNDFATGNAGDDLVWGGNEHDQLFGGMGNDTVHGENGNDSVIGNFGDDVLTGGNGNDFLDGDLPPGFDGGGGSELDPTPGNDDHCNGNNGRDSAFGCETMTSIEVVLAAI